jgi:HAD superfamily hydrolase (TIGR01484 family)
MRFEALATNYDGTLAGDGTVAPSAISALERVRANGRSLFLVTGRELEELEKIFPQWNIFDRVVAENGGLLYNSSTKQIKVLHTGPPQALVD